ncbi:cytochrome P450 [Paenibacillus arenilitoris]|uniref:Cytochrome P450 n=1 Tax=Paenibacillus arenilitoris TaxID=2772299 RepID=A0A927CLQ2_9BACL|nr:cytochrome P450 [Paenibacillus arenilitoris]MBD2868898.1 cytochrome P450 [Paenibacillus arenilitoris]
MKQSENKPYSTIIPMQEIDSPGTAVNPFEVFDRLRESTPVRYDERRNCWDVFRYEDVHYILKNPALFSSKRPISDMENLLIMDPPRHSQMRGLVNQAFTPKAIAALEPRIADIANELLDEAAARGGMDTVHDFSGPLPVIVIAELLGVPARDRKLFKEWSDVLVTGPQMNTEEALRAVMAERHEAMRKLGGYFTGILGKRRGKREEDLISLLLDAEIDGQKLTDQEVLSFCILLLVAGNETTTNLITNAVRYMTEHPEMQEMLRRQPDLMPAAVEEVLRYYPPIQAIGRVTTSDVELGGQLIKAGSQVVNWVASANRDGAKFEDPNTFVPDRKPNPHLSFGFGIHFCLGAPLARLEAKIALNLLLERFGHIARSGEEELQPIQSPFVFGVKSFPVTIS